MLSERLQKRLNKNRPMTTITLSIPLDVVESLQEIASQKGYNAYQTVLKSYISDGLRRDEVQYDFRRTDKLIEALKKEGVPDSVLSKVTQEIFTNFTQGHIHAC